VADAVGKSREAVANLLRLLNLRRRCAICCSRAPSKWGMPARC
jgi:hypothetical protein